MIIVLAYSLLIALVTGFDCREIQHNGIAQLTSCQLNSPPLPLDWQFGFILKYAYYWKGTEEIRSQYFGPNGELKANCSTAATQPGGYSHFWQVMFRETCFSFEPDRPLFALFTVFATYQYPILLNVTVPDGKLQSLSTINLRDNNIE